MWVDGMTRANKRRTLPESDGVIKGLSHTIKQNGKRNNNTNRYVLVLIGFAFGLWSEHSSVERIACQDVPSQSMGRLIVRGTNTL